MNEEQPKANRTGGRRKKGERPDWDGIKREWIAGQLSVNQIAKNFDVSVRAIAKYAESHGWTGRNLSQQVRDTAAAILIQDEGTDEGREAVDMAAARAVEVVRGHRKDLRRLADLRDTFIKLMEEGRESGGLPMVQKVTCLDDAKDFAATLESLARTTARLIPLERQAFNLDAEQETDAGDFLEKLRRGRERAQSLRDEDTEQ